MDIIIDPPHNEHNQPQSKMIIDDDFLFRIHAKSEPPLFTSNLNNNLLSMCVPSINSSKAVPIESLSKVFVVFQKYVKVVLTETDPLTPEERSTKWNEFASKFGGWDKTFHTFVTSFISLNKPVVTESLYEAKKHTIKDNWDHFLPSFKECNEFLSSSSL